MGRKTTYMAMYTLAYDNGHTITAEIYVDDKDGRIVGELPKDPDPPEASGTETVLLHYGNTTGICPDCRKYVLVGGTCRGCTGKPARR